MRIDIAKLRAETGLITFDPGYGNTGGCTQRHHLPRRRGGHPPLPRLPDRAAGRALDLPRGRLPAHLGRAADPRAARPVHHRGHASHPDPGGDAPLLRLLPDRCAPDGGARLGRRRHEHLLPRQPEHLRRRCGRGHHQPADRQASDAGGVVVQDGDRPALRLPAQRPRLLGQPAAHDVRRAVRGVRRRPGGGRCARPASHPARRPRAERVDLDRAPGGEHPRQPVRQHQRRYQRPVGTAARRRERGGHQHPGAHRRRWRRRPEVGRSRKGPERQLPPRRLRASGLQELRSAGHDHQEGRGPRPRSDRRGRRALRGRPAPRGGRPEATSTS